MKKIAVGITAFAAITASSLLGATPAHASLSDWDDYGTGGGGFGGALHLCVPMPNDSWGTTWHLVCF